MGSHALLPVLEPAALAGAFGSVAHRAGLPVTPERAERFARALLLAPPTGRSALYWAARTTLVGDRGQVPVFDAVFAAVFDGMLDPADSRGDPTAPPAVGSEPQRRAAPDSRPPREDAPERDRPPSATSGSSADGDVDTAPQEAVLAMTSPERRWAETSFAELDDDEIAELRSLLRRIVLATPWRPGRRHRPSGHGRDPVDLRRTVRASRRRGGDAMALLHRHRPRRRRRLVFLCDVSGSMEPFTRVYLSLLQTAVAGARAEAFVFSTGLTRVTRALAVRDPDEALARAAATDSDWAGGTRLAAALHAFVDGHGRRGLARGAVVVILSDGWANDDPAAVAAQMARLQRLTHRIVWVNPRKAAPGYAPLVGGMAAALPYCDAFVSGHSFHALREVTAAIGA